MLKQTKQKLVIQNTGCYDIIFDYFFLFLLFRFTKCHRSKLKYFWTRFFFSQTPKSAINKSSIENFFRIIFIFGNFFELFGDLVHGVSQVVNVVWRNSGHRDAAVLRQVDAEVFGQLLNLKNKSSDLIIAIRFKFYCQ